MGGRGPIWAGPSEGLLEIPGSQSSEAVRFPAGEGDSVTTQGSHEGQGRDRAIPVLRAHGTVFPGAGDAEPGRGAGHTLRGADPPEARGRSLGSNTGSKRGHSSWIGSSHAGRGPLGWSHGPHGWSHGPLGWSHGPRSSQSSPWFWWVEGGKGQRSRWRERRGSVWGLRAGSPPARAGEMLGTWSLSGSHLCLFSSTRVHVYLF